MKKIVLIAALVAIFVASAAYSIDTWVVDSDGAQKAAAPAVERPVSDVIYGPETCVKVLGTTGSLAAVRLYSTTEIRKASAYDLYTIEKKDGVWVKKAYIRSIELPPATSTRDGKYRYCSDIVKIEWLSKGHVYQLIPHKKGNHHSSVPFWHKVN